MNENNGHFYFTEPEENYCFLWDSEANVYFYTCTQAVTQRKSVFSIYRKVYLHFCLWVSYQLQQDYLYG